MSLKSTLSILTGLLLLACGNHAKKVSDETGQELDIGKATASFKLSLDGKDFASFINLKLQSDSSRNLITQLGPYKFSTSIDPENREDYINTPDALIYYEYEGLTLKYNFKGAGKYIDSSGYVNQPNRTQLQKTMDEVKMGPCLEEITFEPKKFKGNMPLNLTGSSKMNDVIKILGNEDSMYYSPSDKLRFSYPDKGLSFLFAYDSTITFITLSDTLKK
ncbi:MAG TPA: hypothetical protein VGF30_03120 [Bacteroidia bacterium]